MRKLCIVALTISLAGCATVPYDKDAYQGAAPTRVAAINHCNDTLAGKNFLNSIGLFTCIANAEEDFATAMKLKNIYGLKTYEGRIMKIALDCDAGLISFDERNARFKAEVGAYYQSLSQAYANARSENDAAYSAIGRGLSAFATGYAQGQAAAAANRPVMCTSTQYGALCSQ